MADRPVSAPWRRSTVWLACAHLLYKPRQVWDAKACGWWTYYDRHCVGFSYIGG